ncbi:MAG: divergent polysaccharide deacetylase family protein [Gemmobacter sp.]|nr:divergent polysaccharide deacetylase family protein [Gemmobacter sp.]
MAQGLVRGIAAGAVVSVLGLGLTSVMVPMPVVDAPLPTSVGGAPLPTDIGGASLPTPVATPVAPVEPAVGADVTGRPQAGAGTSGGQSDAPAISASGGNRDTPSGAAEPVSEQAAAGDDAGTAGAKSPPQVAPVVTSDVGTERAPSVIAMLPSTGGTMVPTESGVVNPVPEVITVRPDNSAAARPKAPAKESPPLEPDAVAPAPASMSAAPPTTVPPATREPDPKIPAADLDLAGGDAASVEAGAASPPSDPGIDSPTAVAPPLPQPEPLSRPEPAQTSDAGSQPMPPAQGTQVAVAEPDSAPVQSGADADNTPSAARPESDAAPDPVTRTDPQTDIGSSTDAPTQSATNGSAPVAQGTPADDVAPRSAASQTDAAESGESGQSPTQEPRTQTLPTVLTLDPAQTTDPADRTLPNRPQPGLHVAVDGVRVGRLPRITGPDTPSPDAVPGGQPLVPAAAAGISGSVAADGAALVRNARVFENPDRKPLMSIILIDAGASDALRATLAPGEFPVTLALDPEIPRAAEIAATWRAAGQEVLLLGSGLPARGTASDFEVALESLAQTFPGSLGMIDAPNGGFQADRRRSADLVPALAARGMGLVTWDRGLNSANQIALRDELPTTLVYRELDADGENASTIGRYLDRAAFRAAQEGQVVVVGRMRAETVQAILDWAAGGRVDTVAPAPVSAVLALP